MSKQKWPAVAWGLVVFMLPAVSIATEPARVEWLGPVTNLTYVFLRDAGPMSRGDALAACRQNGLLPIRVDHICHPRMDIIGCLASHGLELDVFTDELSKSPIWSELHVVNDEMQRGSRPHKGLWYFPVWQFTDLENYQDFCFGDSAREFVGQPSSKAQSYIEAVSCDQLRESERLSVVCVRTF